jgi:5-formyltetrahydrofolate cyclo-ligase
MKKEISSRKWLTNRVILMTAKITLRNRMRETRATVPKAIRDKASIELANQKLPSGRILSYASFGSELSTLLFNQRLAEEKRLVLPCRAGNSLKLFACKTVPSHGDILWEPEGEEEIDPSSLSLALVPGLAFDTSCFRLGYGKGYYDRLLPLLDKKIPALGVGFPCQMVDYLPREAHDFPINKILYLGE